MEDKDGSLLDQFQDEATSTAAEPAGGVMDIHADATAEQDVLAPVSAETPEFALSPPQEDAQMPEEMIPGDEGTSAEAVDQMLGEALAEAAELEPAEAPASDDLTLFSLTFPRLTEPQSKKAQEILKGLGITFDPASTLLSRLNEAAAAQALASLRQAGIDAVPLAPGVSPAQETPVEPVSGGAPSVLLPKEAAGVVLLTVDSTANVNVVQSLEPVVAHKSIARRFFREAEAEAELARHLRRIAQPSRIPRILPASASEKMFRGLFQDLQRQALTLGANAVLGLRLEIVTELRHSDPDSEQMRVVALGTAAIVEILHS